MLRQGVSEQLQYTSLTMQYTTATDTLRRPLLLSREEASKSLGIGRTRYQQLIAEGKIGEVKIGRRRLVSAAELERFIAASCSITEHR
jgi:excisionase family DNA binding protein